MARSSSRSCAVAGVLSLLLAGCTSGPTQEPAVTSVHEPSASDELAATVVAPASAGKATFRALPALGDDELAFGLVPVARPLRVHLAALNAPASVTFEYDEARLPSGVEPQDALTVLKFAEEYGVWVPVGGLVDTTEGTITVETTEFSDWTVAVTDPAELADDVARTKRLNASMGGKIANLLTGTLPALSCSTGNLLLPARVQDRTGETSVCQERTPDGRYRLHVVNRRYVPVLMRMPDEFVLDAGTAGDPKLTMISELLRRPDTEGSIVIPAQGEAAVSFPATSPAPDDQLVGEIDWELTVYELVRQMTAVVAGDGGEGWAKMIDDRVASTDKVLDCVARTGNVVRGVVDRDVQDVDSITKAVWDAATKCVPQAEEVDNAFKILAGDLGVIVKELSPKKWGKRVLGSLEFARSEMFAMFAMLERVDRAEELVVRVAPVRYVTEDEALAQPGDALLGDAPGRCPAPRGAMAAHPPVGAPFSYDCLWVVEADLDGNAQPDRLMLWEQHVGSSRSKVVLPTDRPRGVVAYLDDRTFHWLEEPASTWRSDAELQVEVEQLSPVAVVDVNGDGRQEVVVRFLAGANTGWNALLTVTEDDRLHVARLPDGRIAHLNDGGGVAATSGWGCASLAGQRHLVAAGASTEYPGGWDEQWQAWDVQYFRLDGDEVVPVGARGGFEAGDHPASSVWRSVDGCAAPTSEATAARTASSPEAAVVSLLEAAAADDELVGRWFVAGYVPSDRVDRAAHQDAWTAARQVDLARLLPAARRGPVRCTGTQASSWSPHVRTVTCEYQDRSGAAYVMTLSQDRETGGWRVFGIEQSA